MGIAGVYARWKKPGGGDFFSFAMLTVNADNHPFMKPFHKPGEEKRVVVILDPKDYYAWLSVPVDQAKGYFRQWQGALDEYPAPLARAPKSVPLPPRKTSCSDEPRLLDRLSLERSQFGFECICLGRARSHCGFESICLSFAHSHFSFDGLSLSADLDDLIAELEDLIVERSEVGELFVDLQFGCGILSHPGRN